MGCARKLNDTEFNNLLNNIHKFRDEVRDASDLKSLVEANPEKADQIFTYISNHQEDFNRLITKDLTTLVTAGSLFPTQQEAFKQFFANTPAVKQLVKCDLDCERALTAFPYCRDSILIAMEECVEEGIFRVYSFESFLKALKYANKNVRDRVFSNPKLTEYLRSFVSDSRELALLFRILSFQAYRQQIFQALMDERNFDFYIKNIHQVNLIAAVLRELNLIEEEKQFMELVFQPEKLKELFVLLFNFRFSESNTSDFIDTYKQHKKHSVREKTLRGLLPSTENLVSSCAQYAAVCQYREIFPEYVEGFARKLIENAASSAGMVLDVDTVIAISEDYPKFKKYLCELVLAIPVKLPFPDNFKRLLNHFKEHAATLVALYASHNVLQGVYPHGILANFNDIKDLVTSIPETKEQMYYWLMADSRRFLFYIKDVKTLAELIELFPNHAMDILILVLAQKPPKNAYATLQKGYLLEVNRFLQPEHAQFLIKAILSSEYQQFVSDVAALANLTKSLPACREALVAPILHDHEQYLRVITTFEDWANLCNLYKEHKTTFVERVTENPVEFTRLTLKLTPAMLIKMGCTKELRPFAISIMDRLLKDPEPLAFVFGNTESVAGNLQNICEVFPAYRKFFNYANVQQVIQAIKVAHSEAEVRRVVRYATQGRRSASGFFNTLNQEMVNTIAAHARNPNILSFEHAINVANATLVK